MSGQSAAVPRAIDAQVGALRMRYYVWDGQGPMVVLLHPSRGYGRIWDFVVPYLVPDFRVVAPDQRGHGDTERPPAGYAGEDFAGDLEALLDHLGARQAALVGHSLGGRAAQIFAGRHPERVTKLVLLGGPHPESFAATPAQISANREKVEAQRRMPQRFPDARAAKEYLGEFWAELSEERRGHVFEWNMNRHSDGSVSFKYDCLKVAEGLSHMPDDLRGYVKHITCPVLFLVRTRGINNLTRQGAAEIARYYEKAPVQIELVDGTYFAQLESPEQVGRAIKAFLR